MSKQSKRHMGGSGEALPAGAVGEVRDSETIVGTTLINTSSRRSICEVTGLTKGIYVVLGFASFNTASGSDGTVSIELYDGTTSYAAVAVYNRTTTPECTLSTFTTIRVTADNTTVSLRAGRTVGQCYNEARRIMAVRIA